MENKEDIKSKTIKGFVWRFGERLSSQLVSFVVSVVLARLLLPKEYGVIALTMVFINIASCLAVSGLGTSLIQKRDADELDFSTMFHAGNALSLFLYAILFIAAPFIADIYKNEVITPVLRILGLVIPISAINSIQQASISRKLDFKKFFYATLIGTIISGFIGIFMAYHGFGVWSLVGQQLSNQLVNTFTLNRIITWRPKLIFSYRRFKVLFSFGSKFMGANVIGSFFNELKSFIIGIKYQPADLAFYNRGDSFPSLFSNNINNTINAVLFPAMSKVQNEPEALKRAVRRAMMTSSFIMCPILLGLAATSDKLVLILLTKKWLFCVPFMQVLCFQYLFGILGTANLQALNALGRSDVTLKLELYKKPVYLLFIVIGMFVSPLAIAIACTCYGFIGTAFNAWPNRKLIGYSFKDQLKDVSPQFGIALAMGGGVYLIGLLPLNIFVSFFIQVVMGGAFYIGMARLLSLESYNYAVNTIKNIRKK